MLVPGASGWNAGVLKRLLLVEGETLSSRFRPNHRTAPRSVALHGPNSAQLEGEASAFTRTFRRDTLSSRFLEMECPGGTFACPSTNYQPRRGAAYLARRKHSHPGARETCPGLSIGTVPSSL